MIFMGFHVFFWAGTLFGLAVLASLLRSSLRRSALPLPPGPRKLPLVGNLFDLPPAFEWKTYAQWSREYGSDIIHLSLAGVSVIVLSSFEAVDALLEKRSSKYSDRSPLPMFVDLMGWDFHLAMMRYGDTWRTNRRLFNQAFSIEGSRRFRPKQQTATRGLLRRLLRDPDDFRKHIMHWSGEIIMSVAYGIDVLPVNDPYVALAEEAVQSGLEASVPGKFLVDTFPLLKYVPEWLPGAGFKRQAKVWRAIARRLNEVPFAETKRQIAVGTAPHSFVADCLQHLADAGTTAYYSEQTVMGTAATMYVAGSDSTGTALTTFFLAMLANPEAQRRAQAEIDSVTGGKELPTFSDRASMPFVEALVKEVLRWKVVTPLSIPHYLPEEDEYRGYRLPANSVVIGNSWALLQDEKMYPSPHLFKPERFLHDGKSNSGARDPDAAFGYGRRICPGRHMATDGLWIAIASILAVFDITKAVDGKGKVIEPMYEYAPGLVSSPLPFKCSIRPRSKEAFSIIDATTH